MKTVFSFIFLLLFSGPISGQTPKKANPAEKPPTQKEIQEMMKEMQKELDSMSEEDKKEMEKMGIKMPDMKSMQKTMNGVSDAQLKKAFEEDNRIVPVKDARRIASIPPTPSNAGLAGYINQVHNAVTLKLAGNDKADGEAAYQLAKKESQTTALGNAAVGLWMGKYPLLAVYVMGKACMEEPGNVNNINNYAAMLSMLGAEPLSLPILQNLNRQFPNNSTILNNIGQAWFGLGDMDRSARYLDSAIRIHSSHSQANLTKSKIEESKGNTAAAAEAVRRSMKNAYSAGKEDRLNKLGEKTSGKDIDWPFPMPQDPLGLHRFTWPGYPDNPSTSLVLEKEWNDFKDKCRQEMEALREKQAFLEKQSEEDHEQRTKRVLSAGINVNINDILPPYSRQASLKLNYLVSDDDGRVTFQFEKHGKEIIAALGEDAKLQEIEQTAKKAIREKYDPLFGEGLPNPFRQYCNEMNNESEKYLKATNKALYETQKSWLEEQRKRINDIIYYCQYTMWPIDFELAKVQAKISWLQAISGQIVRFRDPGFSCEARKDDKSNGGKLPEFDDIACKYISTMDLHFIKITSSCSRLEGKFNMGPIAYSRKKDTDKDILLSASLAVTIGVKKGWEKGPVAAEAKAAITGQIEWDEKEITNWVVKSEVGVSAGSNIGFGDKSIDIAGVEAAIGMNGSGVKGSGLLQGINISNK